MFLQPPENFASQLCVFLAEYFETRTTAWLETVPLAHIYCHFTSHFVILKESWSSSSG